jgi:hypothetical protein
LVAALALALALAREGEALAVARVDVGVGFVVAIVSVVRVVGTRSRSNLSKPLIVADSVQFMPEIKLKNWVGKQVH